MKGKTARRPHLKVHLDGYNQMDLLTGKGPSKRNEIFYFTEEILGAGRIGDYKYRFIDQPGGWGAGRSRSIGRFLQTLRLDPWRVQVSLDRCDTQIGTRMSSGVSCTRSRRWRRDGKTFIEFPPMQKGASFNMEAVKEQILKGHQVVSR